MTASLRWVFIRPRYSSPYYDPEIQEPLGLACLGALRRCRGDSVLIMDALLESMNDIRLARRAVSFQPDVIGFSIMSAQELPSVTAIHEECRQRLAGRKIHWVAGGNFISHEPDQARAALPGVFDLVRFEGENALDRIAVQVSRGRAPRQGAGRILMAPPVADLDTLPFALRPFADQVQGMGGAFSIQGSRGCLGACRYCSSPEARSIQGSRWRGRTMAHVVEEIATLHQKHGARAFNFIDEDFLGPNHLALQRARDFTDALARRTLQISFSIQVRPDSLSPQIIDLLSRAGLSYVFLGIESDNPEDFKRWGRPWTGTPWDLVAHIRRSRVEVGAGVLLFHPHATVEGIQRFADTLHRHGLLNYRSAINRLDAMPGSVFHRQARSAGMPAQAVGPQRLALIEAGVADLYRELTLAIGPLGPVAMHAVCCLPPMIAEYRLQPQRRSVYQRLKRILDNLDHATAATLFQLLDGHFRNQGITDPVQKLRRRNLNTALDAVQGLVELNLAPSFDQLREAIRMDAGI